MFMASTSTLSVVPRFSPSCNKHDYTKGVKHLVDTSPDLRLIPAPYILHKPPLIYNPSPLPRSPLISPSIPVIDLDGIDNAITSNRRESAVHDIASACVEWGFFLQIVNHGVKASLMKEMLRVADGFFSLTCEEKMKYASNNVMDPVRYGTSLNTSAPHQLHWRDYLRHFGHPLENSYHLWPENPPNYRSVAKEYLEEIWRLKTKIAGCISESLGLDKDYIEKSLGKGCQIIASNYYPPCPQPHLTLGLAAHSDHGGITILMQNDVDGLQVRYKDIWIPVEYVASSFVVNIGDYIEILSNGRYKSVEHRGLVNKKRTRISIAVGHGPEMTTILAPANELVDEKEKPNYKPIVYKDYIRFQQSSAVRGKTPLEKIMAN
ncbi:hypothetical protein GIB67_025214 [Kingdonia uniflora]|uniref:Fe2OG dioxygenase domain-containing protein n=1 Tax=Kingdonia uniflora TaxID=39325 RepID=A0A7J7N8K6_9MAGN|nr:hypothetical protein GIB67_025214 [Kingdonia uniflora]